MVQEEEVGTEVAVVVEGHHQGEGTMEEGEVETTIEIAIEEALSSHGVLGFSKLRGYVQSIVLCQTVSRVSKVHYYSLSVAHVHGTGSILVVA